jgi:hypothetical protein
VDWEEPPDQGSDAAVGGLEVAGETHGSAGGLLLAQGSDCAGGGASGVPHGSVDDA